MTTPDTVLFNDAQIEEDEEPTGVDTLITAVAAEARQDPPDPYGVDGADVKIGDLFTPHTSSPCMQRLAGAPGGYAYCRRPAGHDPRHAHLETVLASSLQRSVVKWVWGKGEAPVVVENTDDFVDPEDAKVESFDVGMFVSYRNMRRTLVVVSRPRKRDEDVEVLDLTHRRFMKIRKDNLVPRRDDDPVITPEEFQWVGQWLADRRKKALEIAKRELSNGRWNRSTMNESLEKLDIAPLPARYGGSVEISISFRFPDGVHPDRAEARRLIEKALRREHEGVTITGVRSWYGGDVNEVTG